MQPSPPSPGSGVSLADLMARLAIGDEYFWMPERLVPFNHWVGHVPFAFWLTKALRPTKFVELGTHRGNSYCAFCQAIATLRIDSAAIAVDTWQGDIHMAPEADLLADLRQHHDPRYRAFSRLLRMTFDEARPQIADGSVDLLHIDGTHSYEAVRHDFETWRSALSPRGVVLFHDIGVTQDAFGVWRLWSELTREHPWFAFWHSHGLGVLGVGADVPEPVAELFRLGTDTGAAAQIRALYEARGMGLVARLDAQELEGRLAQAAAGHARVLEHREAMAEVERAAAAAQTHRLNAALAAAAAEKDTLTQSLAAAAIEQARTNAALAAAAHAAEDAAAKSAASNAALESDLARLREALVALQTVAASVLATIKQLKRSRYWRLTRPLRAVLPTPQLDTKGPTTVLRALRGGRKRSPRA